MQCLNRTVVRGLKDSFSNSWKDSLGTPEKFPEAIYKKNPLGSFCQDSQRNLGRVSVDKKF